MAHWWFASPLATADSPSIPACFSNSVPGTCHTVPEPAFNHQPLPSVKASGARENGLKKIDAGLDQLVGSTPLNRSQTGGTFRGYCSPSRVGLSFNFTAVTYSLVIGNSVFFSPAYLQMPILRGKAGAISDAYSTSKFFPTTLYSRYLARQNIFCLTSKDRTCSGLVLSAANLIHLRDWHLSE